MGHILSQRQNPAETSNPDMGDRKGPRLKEERISQSRLLQPTYNL